MSQFNLVPTRRRLSKFDPHREKYTDRKWKTWESKARVYCNEILALTRENFLRATSFYVGFILFFGIEEVEAKGERKTFTLNWKTNEIVS